MNRRRQPTSAGARRARPGQGAWARTEIEPTLGRLPSCSICTKRSSASNVTRAVGAQPRSRHATTRSQSRRATSSCRRCRSPRVSGRRSARMGGIDRAPLTGTDAGFAIVTNASGSLTQHSQSLRTLLGRPASLARESPSSPSAPTMSGTACEDQLANQPANGASNIARTTSGALICPDQKK